VVKILIAGAGVAFAAVLLLSQRGADMGSKEFECRVRVNAKAASPCADDFLRVVIRNNTAAAVEMRSALSVEGFLDVEVQDADGKRVSEPFYEAGLASPFDLDRSASAGTLKPKQDFPIEISPMRPVREDALRPGKYRCRVRFRYDKIDVTSEFVEFTVTERDLRYWTLSYGILPEMTKAQVESILGPPTNSENLGPMGNNATVYHYDWIRVTFDGNGSVVSVSR
jgi:hypothetical protein